MKVTQEDINAGIQGHCSRCPIALAAKREFPKAQDVRVTWDVISVWYSVSRVDRYLLPEAAQKFIADFDHPLRTVQPIEFELYPQQSA